MKYTTYTRVEMIDRYIGANFISQKTKTKKNRGHQGSTNEQQTGGGGAGQRCTLPVPVQERFGNGLQIHTNCGP